ncbi:TrmH family RNA methyltransferase [Mycoplasmatota bacterium]|nr:TrmH family RNA methyltransferase [Mycoplasmatota bacterium]
MANKFRTYKKDLDYSYTLGIFLTIELLTYKPHQIITVLIHSKAQDSDGVKKIIDLCKMNNVPYEINDKMINILSPKDNCFAVGIFNKYEEKLDKTENHVVLVNPSNSGNLGTIIRTCLGFGVKNLAIIKPSVDIFDPKTVRASMGALFNLSFSYFNHFEDYYKVFHNHDIYPFMLNAKLKIYEVNPNKNKPFALTFGNESSGLDDSFLSIGTSVIIPHHSTIDSLNLSIATGIALYEFTKNT